MKKLILLFGAVVFAGAASAASHTVHVANMQFDPKNITIKPGDEVVWSFDEADHTTTSGTECTKNNMWDSGTKGMGTSFSQTFPTEGTFSYFCKNHCPAMEGTVTVSAASGMESDFTAQKTALSNYPNPFTGTTNFTFYSDKTSHGSLEIVGMDGKKITTITVSARAGQNTIPVSVNLPAGTYVARLNLDATLPEYKLIVKQQ